MIVYAPKETLVPCECGRDKRIDLRYKQALVFWEAETDSLLEPGDIICCCEVEKMTFPVCAEQHCRLLARLVEEGAKVSGGAALAEIELL